MVSIELILKPPSLTIMVQIVAVGIALAAIQVYRLIVDLKKLHSINDEINKYNKKMKEAERSGGI